MFEVKIEAYKLKDYFDQYINDKFWYIVPKNSFVEYIKYLTKYYSGIDSTDYMSHILPDKICDISYEQNNSMLDNEFCEYFVFEFPDEETALYFQLKFCS